MSQRWFTANVAGVLVLASTSALAAPVTITTPFMNLENRAVNSLGFAPGRFARIGANSVVPNGDAGTTGVGTTVDLVSGLTVTRTIDFNPGPIIPNFFSRGLGDSPSLFGAWTLKFSNGSDSAQAVVSLPAGTSYAPFVNTITLSGTSANPTFTWTPPPATTVNGYRINIYDKALITADNNGQVTSRNVAPSITSYTVTGADFTVPGYSFQLGRNYSIEISLIQTKDGGSGNLGNDNLASISRVYADFRPSNSGGPAVNLPVLLANGSFQYNMSVAAGELYYIDPPVAVGYDFLVGAGNPSFRSVVLPVGIGDGLYDIFGLGAGGAATLLAHDWAGGATFEFGAAGITGFRVGGIETSAGLDPSDTTAFVTGVTFTGAGSFTGTQTPLTVDVAAVPEPETYVLFGAGLALLGWVGRRRRRAGAII
jgi:hypothetical protein